MYLAKFHMYEIHFINIFCHKLTIYKLYLKKSKYSLNTVFITVLIYLMYFFKAWLFDTLSMYLKNFYCHFLFEYFN